MSKCKHINAPEAPERPGFRKSASGNTLILMVSMKRLSRQKR